MSAEFTKLTYQALRPGNRFGWVHPTVTIRLQPLIAPSLTRIIDRPASPLMACR